MRSRPACRSGRSPAPPARPVGGAAARGGDWFNPTQLAGFGDEAVAVGGPSPNLAARAPAPPRFSEGSVAATSAALQDPACSGMAGDCAGHPGGRGPRRQSAPPIPRRAHPCRWMIVAKPGAAPPVPAATANSVVAPLARVAVPRPLEASRMSISRSMVNGASPGPAPGPGPCQQLAAGDPIGGPTCSDAGSGWRLDYAAQGAGSATRRLVNAGRLPSADATRVS